MLPESKGLKFLEIGLLLCKTNKTILKSYSVIMINIFEIVTYWKYHQLYFYSQLFRPNTETNVNYLGSPLESEVRMMGKAPRILVIKIAPCEFTGKKKKD